MFSHKATLYTRMYFVEFLTLNKTNLREIAIIQAVIFLLFRNLKHAIIIEEGV